MACMTAYLECGVRGTGPPGEAYSSNALGLEVSMSLFSYDIIYLDRWIYYLAHIAVTCWACS